MRGRVLDFDGNIKSSPWNSDIFWGPALVSTKNSRNWRNYGFQEAPSHLYRTRVDSPFPYWVGYLILIKTSHLYRKTPISFGVQPSSGRKVHIIEEIRVLKRPCRSYTGLVWIPDLHTEQGTELWCKHHVFTVNQRYFFWVHPSSGRNTHEIKKIGVLKRPRPSYTWLDWIPHLHAGKGTWFWWKHQVFTEK